MCFVFFSSSLFTHTSCTKQINYKLSAAFLSFSKRGLIIGGGSVELFKWCVCVYMVEY